MNANIITVKHEDNLNPDQSYECLIDVSDGTLVRINSFTESRLNEVRLPSSVRRITKDFKVCFENRKGVRILRLIIPQEMEFIDYRGIRRVAEIIVQDNNGKAFKNVDDSLVYVNPDGTGTVIKCFKETIPAEEWITVLGRESLFLSENQYTTEGRKRFLDDIIVPGNIKTIEPNAFVLLGSYYAIRMYPGLEKIKGTQDLNGSRIIFDGTVKQWKRVKKSKAYSTEKIAVECTDGTIYECGDPNEQFDGWERMGSCVIHHPSGFVGAVDLRETGDIIIPEGAKEIPPHLLDNAFRGGVILLGGGRNLVLPSTLEQIDAMVFYPTDSNFQIIMDRPSSKYYVTNNILVEKTGEGYDRTVAGLFDKYVKLDESIKEIGSDSILNPKSADVYIPEGIRSICSGAENNNHNSLRHAIYLPKSLKRISQHAFQLYFARKLLFAGTMKEWANVEKEKCWYGYESNGLSELRTIVCSDGEVPIE